MNKTMLVLAVPHQLQGPNFQGYLEDPSYACLVESSLHTGVNFVFEEVAGRGPSIAEGLAKSLLGAGRYVDIDPSRNERQKYGISEGTGEGYPIDPFNSSDAYYCLSLADQRKREELWLQRIQAQHFEKGLVICGLAHCLSISFRLQSDGFSVETYNYMPYNKLCTRPHAE